MKVEVEGLRARDPFKGLIGRCVRPPLHGDIRAIAGYKRMLRVEDFFGGFKAFGVGFEVGFG